MSHFKFYSALTIELLTFTLDESHPTKVNVLNINIDKKNFIF